MFCPECGKKVSDSAKFCNHCGHRLIEDGVQNNKSEPLQKSRNINLIKYLSILFIICFVIIFGITCFKPNTSDSPNNQVSEVKQEIPKLYYIASLSENYDFPVYYTYDKLTEIYSGPYRADNIPQADYIIKITTPQGSGAYSGLYFYNKNRRELKLIDDECSTGIPFFYNNKLYNDGGGTIYKYNISENGVSSSEIGYDDISSLSVKLIPMSTLKNNVVYDVSGYKHYFFYYDNSPTEYEIPKYSKGIHRVSDMENGVEIIPIIYNTNWEDAGTVKIISNSK